ncbi:hypothetical protein PIIN_02894 [Serendipita indica DSM 11827]|uniref:Uncharacterized protein n=1 Tax=Serendipita indica (strain DSM 11827) TaxID=1109443 RepID=G4TCI2_SERID|nr:hypothetical protein PIIN_02894 [Serendipita indica DSM 11827]
MRSAESEYEYQGAGRLYGAKFVPIHSREEVDPFLRTQCVTRATQNQEGQVKYRQLSLDAVFTPAIMMHTLERWSSSAHPSN